jgi:hypothetical protein
MNNVVSTGSLYSCNSDTNNASDALNIRRNMIPICELDFESRLCFNSKTLTKQKSVDERLNKNDFVVDYEKYKYLRRNQHKSAKSLKGCFENENDKEAFEQISLRSNYDSKLLVSDLSFNENPVSNANRNLNKAKNINDKNNSIYFSKTSLTPSTGSNNRLTVNSNHNNLPSQIAKGNNTNINKVHGINENQTPKYHSTYSLVSSTNNNKLCNLTTDYKINYTTNKNIFTTTSNNNNNHNQNEINNVITNRKDSKTIDDTPITNYSLSNKSQGWYLF